MKGADQLLGYRTADMRIFAYAKGRFSHYAAHSNQNLSEPGDWRFFLFKRDVNVPCWSQETPKKTPIYGVI